MEHTGYKEESSKKALCAYIIMTIILGIQQRPLHDYKQTKTLPVITIDGFQTSVRCWKWFTETSRIITVTGPEDTQPSIPLLYNSTRKHPEFSLPCLACTHITCTLLLCCALKLLLLFLRTSQTNSQPTVYQLLIFCQYNIYADFNQYNTRNYQLMQTWTTLQ